VSSNAIAKKIALRYARVKRRLVNLSEQCDMDRCDPTVRGKDICQG